MLIKSDWIQHVRSFFATICPTKDFRAFLENHLSSLFSYQGSYNKPKQREGQHDFSMSDVHSGGSQRWQLQWIRHKHSPRHRGKSTEFVWELLSLLAPCFFTRSLLSLMNDCSLRDRWISNAALHSKINPLSIQVGAMILSSQLHVWINVWNEPTVCVCCTRWGNSRVNRDTHRGGWLDILLACIRHVCYAC